MTFSRSTLEALEAAHGESFYLVDLDRFQQRYDELLAAFRMYYPKTELAYSYKANYLPRLCAMVNAANGYAEVISRMEYDLALRVGMPADRIVVNGSRKSLDDVRHALMHGSIVYLDSPYQVDFVETVAREDKARQFRVGLRVAMEEAGDRGTRFGFDIDNGEASQIFERLGGLCNVQVTGLHHHACTRTRSVRWYRHVARRLCDLSESLFPAQPPQFLDIGGGFFSVMPENFARQFGDALPTFHDYGEAVGGVLTERFSGTDKPTLLLEPGLAVVADAACFVARVLDRRCLHGRELALVAGSVYNVKPTRHDKVLPLTVIPNPGGRGHGTPTGIDIVGDTCMEDDLLYSGYRGEVGIGDYIVFGNVGAYTLVLKPPFIQECPAVLGYRSGIAPQGFELLKHREDPGDVFQTYVFD